MDNTQGSDELQGWFAGRLPAEWFAGAADVRADREEILVVGTLSDPALFGVNELALRVPSLLLSTLSILLTYRICRSLFDRESAFVAAFLHAVNGLLISLAAGRMPTDHVDTLLFFLVAGGAACSARYREKRSRGLLVVLGLLAGLAVLTKWLIGGLAVLLWFVLVLGMESLRRVLLKLVLILAVGCLVVLPWQWHILRSFPLEASWESQYNLRHLFEPLEGHEAGPFYFLGRLPRFFGELVYLPLIWFGIRGLRRSGGPAEKMLLLWLVVPLAIYSAAATKMPAYIMVAAPAVFSMVGCFVVRVWRTTRGVRWMWAARALAVLLLITPARFGVERMKPFRVDRAATTWTSEARRFKPVLTGTVVFNTDHPVELMFYTGATAYSGVPDSARVADLLARGRRIVVLDDGALPPQIALDSRIERVKFSPRVPPGDSPR